MALIRTISLMVWATSKTVIFLRSGRAVVMHILRLLSLNEMAHNGPGQEKQCSNAAGQEFIIEWRPAAVNHTLITSMQIIRDNIIIAYLSRGYKYRCIAALNIREMKFHNISSEATECSWFCSKVTATFDRRGHAHPYRFSKSLQKSLKN